VPIGTQRQLLRLFVWDEADRPPRRAQPAGWGAAGCAVGSSRVLVLHGEPGVGKSVLMEYVARQAGDCRVVRAAGVESEMEFAYAALQ
jgi:putative protein kinase ArgK-like GTPase of G3E family